MTALGQGVLRRVGMVLALAVPLTLVAGCNPRPAISLDAGWSFLRADAPGAEAPGFNDSLWGLVDLPHTWNALDGQDHGAPYYRGIGWYRKHLFLGNNYAGRQLFITFDGANITARVYVNGALVGEHRGGFAAFTFNVTPYVVIGQDNLFAVKVDNSPTSGGPPLSGDFNFNGGLYRSARLTSTRPAHISLTDFSSPGVYVEQTGVTSASANLQVRVKLRNDALPVVNATVRVEVLDADGNSVQVSDLPVTLSGLADSDSVHAMTIANPHLWNGRPDPHLDRVRGAGQRQQRPAGRSPAAFRPATTSRSTRTTGFFLNGQYLDLHGVNLHQDRLTRAGRSPTPTGGGLQRSSGRSARPSCGWRTTSTASRLRPPRPARHRRVGGDPVMDDQHRHQRSLHRQRQAAAPRADPPELQPPVDRLLGHLQRVSDNAADPRAGHGTRRARARGRPDAPHRRRHRQPGRTRRINRIPT